MTPPPPTAGVLARPADIGTGSGDRGGAVWRLAESGRQLDANIVRIRPGARVATHVEPDLDVLLCVVGGDGELTTDGGPQPLEPGCVAWLPHGSRRAVTAGPAGLVYLTAHRRRPGLTIRRGPDGSGAAGTDGASGPGEPRTAARAPAEGGEAACPLNRICPGCDRPADDGGARFCSRCGTPLPS
ncbi:hypothetical protein [Streptomyces qinzhouensis]|uniref:Cupin domain-containing protein n=1 Tax=Streptomyces qinzhouensis TaxID=2599401 RepID=A0A5B8IPS6_9ACTN|nr:hypothetical protein [Streptomyces qinzhouensis]QDY79589.1 hypothetical protein FQU76_27085 [Streptomyces qinzhouensis]